MIWLVSTEHLENELWFRDDDDFRVGMNFVAVQATGSPEVVILAFILMSNHVHFVLKGTKKEVDAFICQFKKRYSLYYSARWGVKKFLRHNGVDIKEIIDDDEALERAIAYVQMNCVAANICAHPSQYLWGTGNIFFNQRSNNAGTRIGDLSARARKSLLHTNCESLSMTWNIGPDGFVQPQDYTDVQAVEKVFRTPRRMNYFLSTSSKARKRIEADEHLPAFRDQTILASMQDLCRSLFGKEAFPELTAAEQAEFMRQLRFRFSADIHQIARVCGLSYADAARRMEEI